MMLFAIGFFAFILTASMVLTLTLGGSVSSSNSSEAIAEAMLTARFYAERTVLPEHKTKTFTPANIVPAEFKKEYTEYDLQGYADGTNVYVYTSQRPTELLEELTNLTEGSLNVGLIEKSGLMSSSAYRCREAPTSCKITVPTKIPLGAVVVRAGNS